MPIIEDKQFIEGYSEALDYLEEKVAVFCTRNAATLTVGDLKLANHIQRLIAERRQDVIVERELANCVPKTLPAEALEPVREGRASGHVISKPAIETKKQIGPVLPDGDIGF